MYHDEILSLVKQSVEPEYHHQVSLLVPTDSTHGDYTSNIAMIMASKKRANPRREAEVILEKLGKVAFIEKIEIAGAGFINFFLTEKASNESLFKELEKVQSQGKEYGRGLWGKDKRVVVEYSSPNIAKRFSVGHLRSTIIGQALYNLYDFSGWKCIGDNHLGDWGTQFGMIIAAVEEKNLDVSVMSVEELEDLYVDFNKRIVNIPELKDVAREAFARLEHGEENARKIWKQAFHVSMKEFETYYEKLGVHTDKAYGEGYYESMMPNVIEEAKKKGIARLSEGAWIIEFEALPPAMLVKSNGTTTYFTRDLATVWFRLFGDDLDMRADLYMYEVGVEQTLHFRQVFETIELLDWAKKDRFVHVPHGRLSLPEGSMSTRQGNTIKLEELLGKGKMEAEKKALGTVYRQHLSSGLVALGISNEDLSRVGMGAIKYNELKRSPKHNYVFRWDEALSMDGDSGPYLQYTCVRAKSVLKQAIDEVNASEGYSFNEEEKAVAIWIGQFAQAVEQSARNYSPNNICTYLFELAQKFNTFYNKHRIVQASDKNARSSRLLLTQATAQVLENGLKLLGISVPEKM